MTNERRAPDPSPDEMEPVEENHRRVPLEHLIPFEGKHVAWSLDGLHIVACGDSFAEVDDKVIAAGITPNRVVYGYVPDPNVSYLGGLFDASAIDEDEPL